MSSVTIVIPAKDEETGLKFLFDDYSSSELSEKENLRFIIVLDGRTSDNSREIAGKFSQEIIDQKQTHGKGSAMKQAIDVWKKERTDLVVFLDADGSYSFSSVKDIIERLVDGADVVSGSRFIGRSGKPEGMSRLHYFGNKALSLFSSVRNRKKITDLCTGLWGFTSESIDQINLNSTGFDLEAELFGKTRRLGLKHVEIPIKWSQRKGGSSKLRSIRDGIIILLRIIMT